MLPQAYVSSTNLRCLGDTLAIAIAFGAALTAGAADPDRSHRTATNGRIDLSIEYPPDRAIVDGSVCGVFVTGRAVVVHGEQARLDVVVVLDTSLSTIEATGADINGNGVVGKPQISPAGAIFVERSSDPGDSVLAAEIAAARELLLGLDSERTRLAVVAFAENSETIEPLTHDHARIDRALLELLRRQPYGRTNMGAGVMQAIGELMALAGTLSSPNSGANKILVFFTDGQPTLPYGPQFERGNVLAVLEAADRASHDGIRIHSFAIGPDALEGPIAAVEMAARTNGTFTPVPHPSDLVELIHHFSLTDLSEVSLRNVTTEAEARPFRLAADGSWAGFIKLVPGMNRMEVVARVGDGTQASRSLDLRLDPQAPPPPARSKFVVRRNELLEVCLEHIRRLRVSAEDEYTDRIRSELRLEIEQERLKARQRAAAQRRTLEISIEQSSRR